ncbi:DUF397 domain-containing protein [Embleya sp. AB8]|uniref:DUF397 domain-containing protein n=1 Tax=Embleya sp. AB8 TaxID=3156304 RepID=UPI003C77630B
MNSNINNRAWRKSRVSNGNQACVEVAPLDDTTGVRDTEARRRGHIEITPTSWSTLLETLKG